MHLTARKTLHAFNSEPKHHGEPSQQMLVFVLLYAVFVIGVMAWGWLA